MTSGGASHDEGGVLEEGLAVEFPAQTQHVQAGAGTAGDLPGQGRFPAAVVEIVGEQAEAVTALGVAGWVVVGESGDGGVERGAADHPGAVVDEGAVTAGAGEIAHVGALLLEERPAGEHGGIIGGSGTAFGEALAEGGVGQGDISEHDHGEIAVEEPGGHTLFAHGSEADGVGAGTEWTAEGPRAGERAIDPDFLGETVPAGDEVVPAGAGDLSGFGAMDQGVVLGDSVAEVEADVAVLTDAERPAFGGILVFLADHAHEAVDAPRSEPGLEGDGGKRSAQATRDVHVGTGMDGLRLCREGSELLEHRIVIGVVDGGSEAGDFGLHREVVAGVEADGLARGDAFAVGVDMDAGDGLRLVRGDSGRRVGWGEAGDLGPGAGRAGHPTGGGQTTDEERAAIRLHSGAGGG